jgi:hypothetical protein
MDTHFSLESTEKLTTTEVIVIPLSFLIGN